MSRSLKADVIFLSPPWGGPDYLRAASFDLRSIRLRPPTSEDADSGLFDGIHLFHASRAVTKKVASPPPPPLPRNTPMHPHVNAPSASHSITLIMALSLSSSSPSICFVAFCRSSAFSPVGLSFAQVVYFLPRNALPDATIAALFPPAPDTTNALAGADCEGGALGDGTGGGPGGAVDAHVDVRTAGGGTAVDVRHDAADDRDNDTGDGSELEAGGGQGKGKDQRVWKGKGMRPGGRAAIAVPHTPVAAVALGRAGWRARHRLARRHHPCLRPVLSDREVNGGEEKLRPRKVTRATFAVGSR